MKRLLLVLSMLIIAGSAFAAELKVSGDFYVRGTQLSNMDVSDDGDDSTYDYFDYDLNLNMAFVANENATVNVRLTYDKNVETSGKNADGSASADDPGLAVERAFLNYKFAPFLQVNTGLMGGGQWGTTFGDTEINVMRVQFIGALSKDMVFLATYQKDDENDFEAATDVKDNEKADQQTYYLSSQLVFGPLTVLPLFTYVQKGINYNNEVYNAVYAQAYATAIGASLEPTAAAAAADTNATTAAGAFTQYDATVMSFTLALKGDFGMFGFEAEGVYADMDTDGWYDDCMAAGTTGAALQAASGLYDGATYGLYANLFVKVDPVTAGFIYAYGSADEEDGSYNWGDDFDMFVVMDDYVSNTSTGLKGFSAYKLYVDATFGKFSAGLAAGMGSNNADWDVLNGITKDAAFTEVDASVSYAFDENVTYTIAGGYAMTTDWYAKDDEENAYRVYNKMSVKF